MLSSRPCSNLKNYTDDPRNFGPNGSGKPRRSFGRRFLLYTLLSGVVFYGGSAYVAGHSERYADFFSQSVPLGETLLDYLDSHDLDAEVSEGARSALSLGKRAYRSISSTIGGAGAGAEDTAREAGAGAAGAEKDARQMLAEARDRAQREARKAKLEAKNQLKDGKESVNETVSSLKDRAESLVDQARAAAHKAEENLRAGLQQTKEKVQDAGAAAKDAAGRIGQLPEGVKVYVGNEPNKGADAVGLRQAADEADRAKSSSSSAGRRRSLSSGSSSSSAAQVNGKPSEPWNAPLPMEHEPPVGYAAPGKERRLQPPTGSEPGVALRADPGAPKLPKLASALSKLGGAARAEPVVAQLAETIDELAAFLKDAPATSSFQAKEVLNLAQADLEKLTDRLEAIKQKEAARVDRTLKEQQGKYERELAAAQDKAQAELGQKDKEWHANLEKERATQMKEYQQKLEKELATQSELINERLREEVIAQGIELQRRWMRDIKARVEQERGGRLARLDELATQVQHLESVARDNARDFDASSSNNTLLATVRALQRILDTPALLALENDDDEGSTNLIAGKKPFREELRKLRSSAAAADSGVISAALDFLDKSDVPDEGVDSFLTLSSWFQDKVRPAVLRTSLLPDAHNGGSAGVLSHLTSAAFSPLLFRKRGLVDGDDVPSILSRAEYFLQREDLDGAAREVNQLKGWGKVLAEDWLDAARKRLEAKQALDVIALEANYKSLTHA